MRSYKPVFVLLFVASFLGCRGGGFVLDPDDADEEIGLPGSTQREFGATDAYEHVVRGEILCERGDHQGAASEFERALASDPADFFLRARLAESYIEIGNYKKARHHIEEILKWDQSNELAWVALAKYHKAKGQVEKAEKAARRAMRVEPNGLLAPLWLARHFRDLENHGRTVEILQGVVLAHPKKAEVRLELAEALLDLERGFEAREHLEVFISLRPFRVDVLKKIAELSLEAGDKEGAQELLEIVISKDPSNENLRLELIHLQLELHLRQRAVRNLETLPPLSGRDIEGGVRRACLLARAGETFKARNFLVDQWGTRPKEPMAALALAEIELRLGRLETARFIVEISSDKWSPGELAYRDALLGRLPNWSDGKEPCGFLDE